MFDQASGLRPAQNLGVNTTGLTGTLDPSRIADGYVESAREFARSALLEHAEARWRFAALHAGTALEHLAKAVLARHSPALLVDLTGSKQNVASLIALAGVRPTPVLRTVGMRGAVERVKAVMDRRWPVSDAAITSLIDVRDGVVHAGSLESLEDDLMAAFVATGDLLLSDLGIAREEFWGERVEVADVLLDSYATKFARRVDLKRILARSRYDNLLADIDDTDVQDALIRSLEDHYFRDDESACDCPVCGRLGIADGIHYVVWDDEVEWDADGTELWSGTVYFDAMRFRCPVCHFTVTGPEEFMAAELPVNWEEDGADPFHFDEPPELAWEPDPDDYHHERMLRDM